MHTARPRISFETIDDWCPSPSIESIPPTFLYLEAGSLHVGNIIKNMEFLKYDRLSAKENENTELANSC